MCKTEFCLSLDKYIIVGDEMFKYLKPTLTVFSAENIRSFKAAAASCNSCAVRCNTDACNTSAATHTCNTSSISCKTNSCSSTAGA